MRCTRYGLVTASAATPSGPTPQTTRKSRNRAPATNSTAVPVDAEHDRGAEIGLDEQQRRRRPASTASGLKNPCAELRSSVWWRTAKIAM